VKTKKTGQAKPHDGEQFGKIVFAHDVEKTMKLFEEPDLVEQFNQPFDVEVKNEHQDDDTEVNQHGSGHKPHGHVQK